MPTPLVGIDAAAKSSGRRGRGGALLVLAAVLISALTSSPQVLAATNLIEQATLNVSIIGRGRVVSVPSGTACTTSGGGLRTSWSCSLTVGDNVQLIPQPAPGWRMMSSAIDPPDPNEGWSGCEVQTDSTCKTIISSSGTTVIARFIPTGILRIGTGQLGTVAAKPRGVSDAIFPKRACHFRVEGNGPFCTLRYPAGTRVSLLAKPPVGSRFFRWSEFCFRANPCTVTARRPRPECCGTHLEVFVTFSPVRLFVYRGEDLGEHGVVTSSPAGIQCPPEPSPCSGLFPAWRLVTLVAHPASAVKWGFSGTGQVGCIPAGGDPTSATCVTRADNLFVGVSFGGGQADDYPYDPVKTFHVRRGGNKQGGITGAGIRCGRGFGDCTQVYHWGQWITLVATANSGSVFRRWRYVPCSGSRRNRSCTFQVGSSAVARAVFAPRA